MIEADSHTETKKGRHKVGTRGRERGEGAERERAREREGGG